MDGLIFNWNFSAVRKVSRWSQEGCRALKWTNALTPLPLSLVHMLGNNCHSSSNKLFHSRTFIYAGIFSRKILLCILCFWKVQLWEKSTKCPGVAKLEKLWKCCASNWNFGPDGLMLTGKYGNSQKNVKSSGKWQKAHQDGEENVSISTVFCLLHIEY